MPRTLGLEFSVNEQNVLAMLCEVMSSHNYRRNVRKILPVPADLMKESEQLEDSLDDIVEKFPNTNWGDLYDRFHRQGKNAE